MFRQPVWRSSSESQPEGSGLNPRPVRGLKFRHPSFATPSTDRDVKLLV